MAGRRLATILLAIAATGGFCPPLAKADDPKLPDAKAFDKLVVDTLRDVHNAGADLYNSSRDFSGTYRMYQGALLTVRPLLAHHPAAQKMIDDGLAAAEKETNTAQKAFRLHEAIEAVRSHLKGETPKKSAEPKSKETKPKEKNPAPGGGGGPGLRGKVTFKGQPLAAGEVTFVSLDQAKPRVFTATIQADGQYAPADVVPPGKYLVIITGKDVPEKYHLTTTSGLTVEVGPPPSVLDFDLK